MTSDNNDRQEYIFPHSISSNIRPISSCDAPRNTDHLYEPKSAENVCKGAGLPHTTLSKSEVYLVSAVLATVGLCSAISMPIYWVALTEIEHAFHITEEQTNLTITAYLVLQAISPILFANASDSVGRRPIILICLLGGVGANIGLAVSNAYWLVVFLRCVLAAFVSPVISITMSAVGDITTRTNRGGMAGIVNAGTLIGSAIAPFIGSVMDTAWKWRAIFWFSAAFDALVFGIIVVLLPETRRSIVGNLGYPPKSIIHKSPALLYLKWKGRLTDLEGETVEKKSSARFNPFGSFLIILAPEVTMCLLPTSILFSTFNMTQASLSTVLEQSYGYSTIKVGLCFFTAGGGFMVGSLLSGRLLDYGYRRMKKQYDEKYLKDNEKSSSPETDAIPPFNIIKARMNLFGIPYLASVCFTLVFGWCLDKQVNVAPILVSLFGLSVGCMYPLTAAATILVDLYPEKAGSSTSMYNFFRCGMSAIFISCLSKMNAAMTLGGTYSFMAGISFLGTIVVYLLIWKSDTVLVKRQQKRLKMGLTF